MRGRIEYAVILMLVAVAIAVTILLMGARSGHVFG